MVERSDKRGSFKGAVVFPGGVLDPADRSTNWPHCYGLTELTQRQQLKIAAVRETFEEAGILLTRPRVELSKEDARIKRSRVRVNGAEFMTVCQELNAQPDLERLRLVQNWVTPLHVPSRFDTFFFIAVANSARGAEVDGMETVRLAWLPPSVWLDHYERQDVSLLPPQYYLLSTLAGLPQLDDLSELCGAIDEDDIRPWMPVRLSKEEGPGMCYPGDASYPSESPLLRSGGDSSNQGARHRLYMKPVSKIEGGVGGRGMESAVGGAVAYELERNVQVPFAGKCWGGGIRRVGCARAKL